jgi:hypothetical protein
MATTKERLNEFIRSGPDPHARVTAAEAPAPPAAATDPPVTPAARTPLVPSQSWFA